MAKYNYDKSMLDGLKVGPFLNEVKVRDVHIDAADTSLPKSVYNANVLAKKLHPHFIVSKVSKVVQRGSSKEYCLQLKDSDKKSKLPYFRAGQYISIILDIDGITTSRSYTICSNPQNALSDNSSYSILVKPVKDGLVSNYILQNWKVGTTVLHSAPLGNYYYTNLRDARHVVALAGGSGITPFFSMASAIASDVEDFRLTILYGSRTAADIIFKDELDALAKRSGGKIKVVHILSDENISGYEHGFINADIIKKYTGDSDYSVFVCGPSAMYDFVHEEIKKLGLPQRRARFEVPGESLDVSSLQAFENTSADTTHNAKVHIRNRIEDVKIPANLPIMRGLENAGIRVPSDCRSGKCGWCRSRLISGKVYYVNDYRRMADKKFGWIHPCSTYAQSDIEIEIFQPF